MMRRANSIGLFSYPPIALACVVILFLAWCGALNADVTPVERIAWHKVPIVVELPVGNERLVHFANAVTVGVPPHVQSAVRIQSIAGTVYLLAHQPFASTRVIVRDLDAGHVYLLDLSASTEDAGNAPIEIYLPDAAGAESGTTASTIPPQYSYVALTRFAAQQLYAPTRLTVQLPGVIREPVKSEAVALVRGGAIEAEPLIAWRTGDLHLIAVKLNNTTRLPQTLDPRTLRGDWLTATFQHNHLHPSGDEADRTVVYLISTRPFWASLN